MREKMIEVITADKTVVRRKLSVCLVCVVAGILAAVADLPDTLYFLTGGSLSSTEILSVSAASPTTVF